MSKDVSRRLTEDGREVALARVKKAFTDGHLAHAELEAHLDSVLAATTEDDLAPVLAALPSPRIVTLGGMNGAIRRSGAWHVPPLLEIQSEHGKVDLDLTRAIFDEPVATIDLHLRFGRARLTLPPGMAVDLDALRCVWKQPSYEPPEWLDEDAPGLVVTGYMEFGRLRVRYASR
jgi:hypothetical protein